MAARIGREQEREFFLMDTVFQLCGFGKMDDYTLSNGEGENFMYMYFVKIITIITIIIIII